MNPEELDIPERFEVLEVLQSSPLEVILRARDKVLLREVVLKCPGPELENAFRDRSNREAALREARALASLRSDGVARILEIAETSIGPLLVLEPTTGESLQTRLAREGPLSAEEVTTLGTHLARLLGAVHKAGIVHRGISTANVILTDDGSPILTGFHFAKHYSSDSIDRSAMSSIQYSRVLRREEAAELPENPSPEQLSGLPANESSDLFSLGVVLFEALTGQRPFLQPPVGAARPQDLAALAPTAPKFLVRAILTCLALSPLRRFRDAAGLQSALEGKQASANADGSAPRESARPGRRIAMGAGLAVIVSASVYLGQSFLRGDREVVRAEVGRGLAGTRAGTSPGVLTESYERSIALLIGIGAAYEGTGFPVLSNAEGDVDAIADFLKDCEDENWDVRTLLGKEATRTNIVETLSNLAEETGWNDRVLLYYAGHGIPHDRSESSGWIVPVDAALSSVSTYLRFDEFYRFFEEARAKHILIAMDCCYGGRLVPSRSASPGSYGRRYMTLPAHVVLASGRVDEQVSDGVPGERSPFARAFLHALEDREPTTSSLLFAKIQVSFLEANAGHTPQLGYPEGSPVGGEFVFFPR